MPRYYPFAPLLVCLALSACSKELPRERRSAPVILFLVDTLRADHLGTYGYTRDTSPALDALAQDGVVFEQCQAQSSWTKPASASILTGLLPSAHHATHMVSALAPEHLLLAEPLRDAGYRTAAFGSNGFVFGSEQGFTRGFDVFQSGFDLTGNHVVPAETLVDSGLDWLDTELSQSTDERLFLYLHAVDPHDPYAPPADLRDRFTEPLGPGELSDSDLARPVSAMAKSPDGLSPEAVERMVGLYDSEILAADRALGRLLEGLKERGLYDEALVVFVADHGEEFFEHDKYGHNPRLFQEVLHVPLVVKFPKRLGEDLGGRRFEPRVNQVDVLPTMLDTLGIELAPAVQTTLAGQSLLKPLFEGGEVEDNWNWKPAITEVDYEGVYRKSLIRGSFKYVRTWVPEPAEILYDLDNDPGERVDVGSREPARLEKMRGELGEMTTVGSGGWTLMLANSTDAPVRATALVTYDGGAFEGIDPLHLELIDMDPALADGPFDQGWVRIESANEGLSSVQFRPGATLDDSSMIDFPGSPIAGLEPYVGRAVWFTCVLEAGDEDGMLFVPGLENSNLKLRLWAENQPVDPSYVLLGPDMQVASQLPLLLDDLEGVEVVKPPSLKAAKADRPIFAWVWKNRDPANLEVELSEATKANIKGLGYVE